MTTMMSGQILDIITVTYNDLEALRTTRDSILRQAEGSSDIFEKVCWVIMDGGSDDHTVETVERWRTTSPLRILFTSEPDDGIYDAMNKAVRIAQAPYLLFLNAGDELIGGQTGADLLEVMQETLNSHDGKALPLIYGDYVFKFGELRILRKARSLERIGRGLPTSHQAMLFPSWFCRDHQYPGDYKSAGDYALTCTAFMEGLEYIDVGFPIAVFEVGGFSFQNRSVGAAEVRRAQRDILGLSEPTVWWTSLRRYLNYLVKFPLLWMSGVLQRFLRAG